jgi:hypothetical protein
MRLRGRIVQWNQDASLDWEKSHCRMVGAVQFEDRGFSEPISADYGLSGFRDYFAMRARTQLRFNVTTVCDILVVHDDGMSLAIYEIGTVDATGTDTFYTAPKVVRKAASPGATVPQSQPLTGVTFEAGKVYTIDLKYWQRWGLKVLKVSSAHSTASDAYAIAFADVFLSHIYATYTCHRAYIYMPCGMLLSWQHQLLFCNTECAHPASARSSCGR